MVLRDTEMQRLSDISQPHLQTLTGSLQSLSPGKVFPVLWRGEITSPMRIFPPLYSESNIAPAQHLIQG